MTAIFLTLEKIENYFILCLTDCDILMSQGEMVSQVKYKREIKSQVRLKIGKELLSWSELYPPSNFDLLSY